MVANSGKSGQFGQKWPIWATWAICGDLRRLLSTDLTGRPPQAALCVWLYTVYKALFVT